MPNSFTPYPLPDFLILFIQAHVHHIDLWGPSQWPVIFVSRDSNQEGTVELGTTVPRGRPIRGRFLDLATALCRAVGTSADIPAVHSRPGS